MTIPAPFFKAYAEARIIRGRKNLGVGGCEACGLYKQCNSPKMAATGEGRKGIFILAEAPGKNEDEQGIQLIGKSGRRLRRELANIGIDLDKDCRKMNAVNCRPPKNRTPTDLEIAYCRNRVFAEINEFKPKVILALGGPAMKSLCQHRAAWDTGFPTMQNWQGEKIPDQELGCWIIPTWHPAFIERMEGHQVFERKWKQDLKAVCEAVNGGPPEKIDYSAMVQTIIDPTQAARKLEEAYNQLRQDEGAFVSFDYETTGLKPYLDGHKIVCCSMAWNDDSAISFLTTNETWPWIYKILRNPHISKGAHNMKFEHLWTCMRGQSPNNQGFTVRNWQWDSMLAAHILDNRIGRTGLKFQAYIKFGVLGYDDAAGPYIRSAKSANSKNKVESMPVNELLLYCAYDSLFERKLAYLQMREIKERNLMDAYNLFHNGALTLVDAEMNGIVIDLDYCKKQKDYLDRRITHMKKKMNEYPEVKLWRRMARDKFSLASSQQLSKLLYEKLDLEPAKRTATGAASVDKAVLEDIDLPFIQDLLEIRKFEKIRNTYLESYIREAPDGFLHPFYHLNKVISYRGSCSDPNFQNIPKRDSVAKKIVRRALLPYPGFCWFEVDYSGIEVRIAATYHKDPEMIRYLKDPSSDMHRDTAMDLCFLTKEQTSGYLRQAAKNGFVFAQFYGDWYKACAENLWHKWFNSPDALLADGKTHIKTWLAKKGIKNLERFTKHVEEVEYSFWNERFPVYNEWRENHWKKYLKKGSFRSHTGFEYTAIMARNDATNYGVQGVGFHCLLWSMTKVHKKLKEEYWKSFLIGQIHDAMDGNAHPEEINVLIPMIRDIMIHKLMTNFSWINVPLDVEFDMSPLGKSWYNMKTISKRPKQCDCGLEWGYADKESDGAVRWTCPICEYFETVR